MKYSDDKHDALWLAHVLRLRILPEGSILRKPRRTLRDLLRRRLLLVQGGSVQVLTVQGLVERTTAQGLSIWAILALDAAALIALLPNPSIHQPCIRFRIQQEVGETVPNRWL